MFTVEEMDYDPLVLSSLTYALPVLNAPDLRLVGYIEAFGDGT